MFRPRFGSRTSYLLPSTILLICLISTSSAKCYFPNGKVNSNYEQCSGYVSCCLKGDSCLSNGLCFGAKLGILYRGPCANESWPAALCPDACYKEIDDGRANLFQCNTSVNLWTCSQEISAPAACQEKNALGTFIYTPANVTVAQNGMSTSEDLDTTSDATSCDSVSRTATPTPTLANSDASSTCPSTVSYNKTQLVAIGAGLGAGLGIPLLLVGGLLFYCSQGKRRQREQLQQQNQKLQQQYEYQYEPQIPNLSRDMKRQTGSNWKPSELRSSFVGNELAGSTQNRSELPGSHNMI